MRILNSDNTLDCDEEENKGIYQFYKWDSTKCTYIYPDNNDDIDYNTPGKTIVVSSVVNPGVSVPHTLKSLCVRDETTINFTYDGVSPEVCSTNIQEGTVILVKGDDSVLSKINFTKTNFNNKVFIMRFMLCLKPDECSGSYISTYR